MQPLVFSCLLAVAILAATACSNEPASGEYENPLLPEGAEITFDAEKWRDEEQAYAEPYPRQQMLRSLRKELLKDGMAKDEIVALLGPATDTDKFADHGLVYWVGSEPSALGVDSQWLLIDFDDEDGLAATSVTTD